MQLKMLLRPAMFPFLHVREALPAQSRRGDLTHAKSQVRHHSAEASKSRRFTA